MISELSIRNFQSIATADLDLTGWTSLVGESDVGKSAIVRAVHALLTNRRGDGFIREGAKACAVTLVLDDGTNIEWHKTRGASGVYTVSRAGVVDEVYEKTAGEVPPEVARLLGVTVDIAGEPFTPGIQRQHDAPFLLADSARRRAQVLGEFDGSNIVLRAEGMIRTAQRAAQQAVKAAEQAAERADAALEAYAAVPALQAEVQALDDLYATYSARRERCAHLLDDCSRLGEAQRAVVVVSREAAAWAAAGDPLARYAALHAAAGRVAALSTAREGIRRAQAAQGAAGGILAAVPGGLVERAEALRERAGRRDRLIGDAAALRTAQRRILVGTAYVAPLPGIAAILDHEDRIDRVEALRAARGGLLRAHEDVYNLGAALAACDGEHVLALADLQTLAGQPCPECGQPIEVA